MNHTMPLVMAAPGELVTVIEVRAGGGLQRRLADMGLTPGVKIKMIRSQMPGPVLIDLRGSKVALGHGIAHKIVVQKE
jgi:ferrous iron transport protein A